MIHMHTCAQTLVYSPKTKSPPSAQRNPNFRVYTVKQTICGPHRLYKDSECVAMLVPPPCMW